MHSFKNSLAKGKAGEALFLAAWPDLEQLDGRRSDFRHKVTGDTYELKSDQYDMAKTENFFIELWSNAERLKPGGPLQALKHESDFWCYMFVKNKVIFEFHTNELVDWVLQNAHKYGRIAIPNKSWTTTGMKVPRTALTHLYTRFNLE